MKKLNLSPVKHASGKWVVVVPARLSECGKRQYTYFPTKAAAVSFIASLESTVASMRKGETLLSSTQVEAFSVLVERLRPFGVTLKDAVDYYIERHRAADARKVAALVPLYLEAMSESSADYRATVRQIMRHFVASFGECLLDDIVPERFEAWLAGLKPTVNGFNSGLRHIKPFFSWAIGKKYAVQSPAEGVRQRKQKRTPIAILSPAQARGLLAACRDFRGDGSIPAHMRVDASDFSAAVAVLLFAGVRPDELFSLDWEHVKLEHGYIRIEPEVSKTNSVRLIKIEPVLSAWLSAVPKCKREGLVVGRNGRRKWRVVRRVAGISELQDVCRHSYASYWLALHRDVHGLLENMGHTTSRTAIKYYLTACAPEDVAPYWGLRPEVLSCI